jgi:acetylornithine deacetylase
MSSAVLDTPLDHPIVTTMVAETESVTGAPAVVEAFTGATDAPNFHCPAVIMGPGAIEQAHTLDEYASIAEIEAATEVYLRAALALLA